DGCDAAAVVVSGKCTNEGSGEGEGEGEGKWEGEDVILEGEVEGSETSSMVGNKATSWPGDSCICLFECC
ncbi:hypothetical protein Tco_0254107, partial [Tanacetum coccineum]